MGRISRRLGEALLGKKTNYHYNSKKYKRQREGEKTFRYLAKYHERTCRRQKWYDFKRAFGIGDELGLENPFKVIWGWVPIFRLKKYPVRLGRWGKWQSQVKLPKAYSWNAGYYMWEYLGIFLDRFIYDIEYSNCGYRYLDGKPHDGIHRFEDDPDYRPMEQIITNPDLKEDWGVFMCVYANYPELKELQRRYHSFDPDEIYVSTKNGLIPWLDFQKKYGKVNFNECTHGYQLATQWIRDFAPYMLGMVD